MLKHNIYYIKYYATFNYFVVLWVFMCIRKSHQNIQAKCPTLLH